MTYVYEEFLKQLGAKLRAMRLERGWTLRDMIVQHGYHLVQWQYLEKGKGLSVPSLLRLCKVFDVRLSDLVDGLGEVDTSSIADHEKPVRIAAKRAVAKGPAKRAVKLRPIR